MRIKLIIMILGAILTLSACSRNTKLEEPTEADAEYDVLTTEEPEPDADADDKKTSAEKSTTRETDVDTEEKEKTLPWDKILDTAEITTGESEQKQQTTKPAVEADEKTSEAPSESASDTSGTALKEEPEEALEVPKQEVHTHAYNIANVPATCTREGYTTHICNCGTSYTDNVIQPLGHAYEETVMAPTTEAGGYTQHTCSRCGDTYRDSETPKLQIRYDIDAAMAAGNAHAQSLGFIVDYSLSLSGVVGYSPPTVISGDIIASLGGQSWLNQSAIDAAQYEYDCILGVDGALGEIRGRCCITYDVGINVYEIYFLYG